MGGSMPEQWIANDVWGLQHDPEMASLLAARHSPCDRHAQPRQPSMLTSTS